MSDFGKTLGVKIRHLYSRFPALYRLFAVHDSNCKFFSSDGSWDFKFFRNLSNGELREVLELIDVFERVIVNGVLQNGRVWAIDSSGCSLLDLSFPI